jgi:hypothetical protein
MNQSQIPSVANPSSEPTRPDRLLRRFTIADTMIVVALVACLFAICSESVAPARIVMYARNAPGLFRYLYLGGPLSTLPFRGLSRPMMVDYLRWTPVTILGEIGFPLLPLSTLAFLMFRMRKPRPPWRELLRQPGMSGILAAVLAVLIEVDLGWLSVPIPTPIPLNIGLAVATTWCIQAITGLWRAERSWVDRLGRSLCLCWMVLGFVVAAEELWRA